MSVRFWIKKEGDWFSPDCWSETLDGPGGATVPADGDHAIISAATTIQGVDAEPVRWPLTVVRGDWTFVQFQVVCCSARRFWREFSRVKRRIAIAPNCVFTVVAHEAGASRFRSRKQTFRGPDDPIVPILNVQDRIVGNELTLDLAGTRANLVRIVWGDDPRCGSAMRLYPDSPTVLRHRYKERGRTYYATIIAESPNEAVVAQSLTVEIPPEPAVVPTIVPPTILGMI